MEKVKVDSKYDNHFDKHELFIEIEQENLKVYDYRQPDSSNGYMKIIITGCNVIITGDYGDAIYGYFSTPQYGLEWLAGLNIGYFNGKCEASESGRDFKEWDYNKAFENFQHNFIYYFGEEQFEKVSISFEDLLDDKEYKDFTEEEEERFIQILDSNNELKDWEKMSEKERLEFSVTEFNNLELDVDWNELKENLGNQNEWASFINNNTDVIETVFGYDYWEFLYSLGETIAFRCHLHLDGIKRASNARCDMEELVKVEEKY